MSAVVLRRAAAPKMEFFVTAAKGIEPLLAQEIKEIVLASGAEIEAKTGGVRLFAPLSDAYRVCLWSRVAQRVLMPIHRFRCENEGQLYGGVKGVRWTDHLDVDGTLAVDFTERKSAITHTQYGALKTKDAIVDQFRSIQGRRPSVDVFHPDLRINVHLNEADATVSIDLSGESLHRRGYREEGSRAPLKETLAAAILLLAEWPRIHREKGIFYDPMCGSGTLVIEAAMMAADIAPGLDREYYGFLGWKKHDAATWDRLITEARQRRAIGLKTATWVLQGSDVVPAALRSARSNADRLGLGERVKFFHQDVLLAQPPVKGSTTGLVGVNPPYGERLGDLDQLKVLYTGVGSTWKHRFHGWKAFLFTGNSELAKEVGLKTTRRFTLFNGPIECRLFTYDLYKGSRKG